MLFLRRLHRETLDFVNCERTKAKLDPISDLPMGFRGEDLERNPVATALQHPFPIEDDWKEVDPDSIDGKLDALGWFLTVLTGKGAAVVWVFLFEMGMFSRYNAARLFERRRIRHHQRLLLGMRELPSELQEKYLRTKALMRYASRES